MSSESLQTLFSDSSKNNFARLFKPVEFVKKNKPQDQDSDQVAKKKKKPKHKHSGKSVALEISQVDPAVNGNEKDQRTCFVGNISTSDSKKTITKFFKENGEIESIRFRSVPVEGTAVDEHGNQNLVKKICTNKQKFGDQKGSFNAYVVFKEASAADAAVSAMNNRVFGGRHLRVDHCVPSVLDPRSTVFLGSLPFYADEEELRGHFAKVLASGHEDIDSVRIIRDPETLIGKGIAYVSFKNHDAVLKALTLDQSLFRKRKIRISTCGKRTKRSQQQQHQRVVSESKVVPVAGAADLDQAGTGPGVALCSIPPPTGKICSTSNSKKRKRSGPENDTPAERRIQMKRSLAKQQQQTSSARGKSFNANKKKGKLGGVIKTAIKNAKASKMN